MCRKYSPTTELPSLKLTFLHLNKNMMKNERIRVPFGSFKAYFQVEKLWFFGGVSRGFKYFSIFTTGEDKPSFGQKPPRSNADSNL